MDRLGMGQDLKMKDYFFGIFYPKTKVTYVISKVCLCEYFPKAALERKGIGHTRDRSLIGHNNCSWVGSAEFCFKPGKSFQEDNFTAKEDYLSIVGKIRARRGFRFFVMVVFTQSVSIYIQNLDIYCYIYLPVDTYFIIYNIYIYIIYCMCIVYIVCTLFSFRS